MLLLHMHPFLNAFTGSELKNPSITLSKTLTTGLVNLPTVPCGDFPVNFGAHVKIAVSYRIVSWRSPVARTPTKQGWQL